MADGLAWMSKFLTRNTLTTKLIYLQKDSELCEI